MSTNTAKKRLWDDLLVAFERQEPLEGVVISKAEGGLAVDVGIEAFLPVDQIGLDIGQDRGNQLGRQLRFLITEIDVPNERIVLSRRALLEREREKRRPATLEKLEFGASMTCVVTAFADHGATVDLGGVDAVLPLYEMGWERINHPSELLHIGDELSVNVLSCDPDAKQVVVGLDEATAANPDAASMRERIARNREHCTVRILRFLYDHPDLDLDDEVRSLLFEDPRLIGTLAGAITHFEIPAPEELRGSPPISRLETDLSFLALRVRMSTGTSFTMTVVPGAPSRVVLANVSALGRLPEGNRVLPSFSQFRDQWCGSRFKPGSPAREAAQRASEPHMKRAAELLAMLRAPETIPVPLELPTSTQSLGIITYCSSVEALDSFMEAVRIWDENFALFGRNGLSLTVSDDSSLEWSERVKKRLQDYESKSGLKVRYIGYDDRQAAIERLVRKVRASDKAKRLDRDGTCPLERLGDALVGMFGPRGVTQNRNWALLSLPMPCVQVDDDHLPELFAVSQQYSRARYEAAPNLPEGANDFPSDIFPVDILGMYENMPAGTLGSPMSSGADEEEVNEVVSAAGRRGSESLETEPAEGRTYLLQATFEDLPAGQTLTRGPIFLPARLPNGSSYCYLQPPVRDGDMAVASCFEAMGKPPDMIRVAIHHRADSGSRVGSPANLLAMSTLAQLVWSFLRLLGSRVDGALTSEQLGWTILEALERHPNGLADALYQWQLADSIRCAAEYIENRLGFERERSSAGGDATIPDDVQAMARQFGLEADLVVAGDEEQKLDRQQAIGTIAAALEPEFVRSLQDYAWSAVFWNEIAEAADKLGFKAR